MVLVGKKAREKKATKEKAVEDTIAENNENMRRSVRRKSREHWRLHVIVIGDPKVVDNFIKRVTIDAESGVDTRGVYIDRNCDLYLCVYDIRDKRTVDFLKKQIMPNFRYSTKKKAIAGLGLENRPFGGVLEVEIGTASQLAKEFKCRGSELVTCDPHQLTAGVFSLYSASCPEKFMDAESQQTPVSTEKTKKEKKSKEKKNKDKKAKSA